MFYLETGKRKLYSPESTTPKLIFRHSQALGLEAGRWTAGAGQSMAGTGRWTARTGQTLTGADRTLSRTRLGPQPEVDSLHDAYGIDLLLLQALLRHGGR